MSWDRKRLLGYVETIQLILGVADKSHCRATEETLASMRRVRTRLFSKYDEESDQN